MTLREAYKMLDSRLLFGDPKQIEAVNFIAAVEAAHSSMKSCPHTEECVCDECDGEGEVDCECGECGHEHERTCSGCGGTGENPVCKICIPSIRPDVYAALCDVLKRGWPKIQQKEKSAA